ncbi:MULTISPECIES: carboxymuconolactone decarboxylase family protein [Duganella]|uniref:carboxymuconolactone decarboxylase family protein n=1 Tax=Duganella TaxID=75654 RepID=UPI0030E9958A
MNPNSPLLDSNLLRRIAPLTLGGYGRFRHIVNEDGALPAKVKALCVAAAATSKGYHDMASRELRRARDLGLRFDEAASAAIVLSSVRGEAAALKFLEQLEAAYPGQQQDAAALQEIEVAPGEAEKNFLAYFGSMPPSLGKFFDVLPLGADAYYLMREGTINGTPLGKKFSELLLVTVLAADYSPLVSVHIKGARTAGASEAEIAEAIVCAVITSGLSAWVNGANAMDA